MGFVRSGGVLLHPTSLPGPHGIGELGQEALRFADWLTDAGLGVWQVLPVGPVGYGESPYQSFSAFAGNPLLISLDTLVKRGWLAANEIDAPGFPEDEVSFERVIPWKGALLRRAFERFRGHAIEADGAEFESFIAFKSAWLQPYARFMALKEAHQGAAWVHWDAKATPLSSEVEYHQFLQWEVFRQWDALRAYCAKRGILLVGDVPVYVAHDSADVWAQPELFQLDKRGYPLVVAGVPPDYFSATGQLWGNPIYRWDRMAESAYRWWVERMRAAFEAFDIVRLDHFRGFEAYWEVPAGDATAENGRWVKGPGSGLFRALKTALGSLPLIAENLGVITPEVEAIREEFGFPGMSVLQFAFGNDPQAPGFRPHNYVRNLAAYTGTHDNDTVIGWWRSEGGDSTRTPRDVREEKARARAYLATDGREMNWVLIRALLASVADLAIFPVQDVLGLDSAARMNTPAVAGGNWRWRMRSGALTPAIAARLREMARLYDRGFAV